MAASLEARVKFLALLKKLHIHPAWTPTEASWLNLIEAQVGVLKEFTLANTDDPNHECRRKWVYAYLRYRHRRLGNSKHPLKRLFNPRRISWNTTRRSQGQRGHRS
jgi:hypothetical protein